MPRKQPNSIDVELGIRMRNLRTLSGMSLENAGNFLGLSFQQVLKYERGVNRIGAVQLYELARIHKVPVNYFFDGLSLELAPCSDEALDSLPSTMDIDASGEECQLTIALMKIKDPKVRKRVLDLVKVLAAEEEQN
jgi:transcriptional regulator with XRE-family HTH domain